MNAGEVIDRALNEWLHPGDENRPTFDTLDTGIDASTTTIVLDGRLGSDAISDDGVLEIDNELILIKSVSGTTVTAQERGWLDSAAATHTAGVKVTVDPDFPRKTLLNHLSSIIARLPLQYVFKVATTDSISVTSSGPQALPSGAFKVNSVRYLDGTNYYWLREGVDYEQFRDVSPCEIQFMGSRAATGSTAKISYASAFTDPTTEATSLDVPTSLQPYLPMAVAGLALLGREPTRAQLETIRAALESQNVPVGSALNVGRTLIGMFEQVYVQAERQRLRAALPSRIVRRRG